MDGGGRVGLATPAVAAIRKNRPGEAESITVRLEPVTKIHRLAADWQELESRAEPSFFLTWAWIGAWLRELPRHDDLLCLSAHLDERLIALGIFTKQRSLRHRLIPITSLHLHETGSRLCDLISIEENGLLLDRDMAGPAAIACLDHLQDQRGLWDEIAFNGVDDRWRRRLEDCGFIQAGSWESEAPYLDLAQIDPGAPLAHLGTQTRHQIRRSRRLYGTVGCIEPQTKAELQAIWEEMIDLHQAAWQARGEPGVFANPFLRAFHERLIAERWPEGNIQLLKFSGDGGTIGCLYNLVHRGRVYTNQSGFVFTSDNRLKPGLVSHQAAIEMNRERGMKIYDFLAGEARYKRSLANRTRRLSWLTLQRPSLTARLDHGLTRLRAEGRELGAALRSYASRGTPSPSH